MLKLDDRSQVSFYDNWMHYVNIYHYMQSGITQVNSVCHNEQYGKKTTIFFCRYIGITLTFLFNLMISSTIIRCKYSSYVVNIPRLSEYESLDKLDFIEVLDQCSHSVERFDGDDESLACKNFDMDHKGWCSVIEYDERFCICHMDSRS